MRSIYKLYIFFFMLLFSSCDYFYSYDYEIINDTAYEVIIKTSTNPNYYELHLPDSIYQIKQGEKVIFSQYLGSCGKNYIPEDIYLQNDSIPSASKFDIFVDGVHHKNLRLRLYWNYESKKRIGIYTLRIAPEILQKQDEYRSNTKY